MKARVEKRLSLKIDSATRVQFLDESVCVSLRAILLMKGITQFLKK